MDPPSEILAVGGGDGAGETIGAVVGAGLGVFEPALVAEAVGKLGMNWVVAVG